VHVITCRPLESGKTPSAAEDRKKKKKKMARVRHRVSSILKTWRGDYASPEGGGRLLPLAALFRTRMEE
jgi:hypothetical protein